MKRTGSTVPLLLLDDIFDKLDASRVEQIVKLVAGDNFGQIFITDTNREHLDRILYRWGVTIKCFVWRAGAINEMEEKRDETKRCGTDWKTDSEISASGELGVSTE